MCSLPQGWEVKKLGEVCDVFTDGDWIESKHQSIEGIRLIQTGNIGFGVYKDKKDKARFISEETFSRLKCTEVLPNDLLISRLPDPVGKSCIVPNIISKMITGVDCTIVRTVDNLVPKFLLYYQMSNQYLMDVELRITGATRSRISRKNLGLINIPLPPLPEQKRIVAILEKAFTAIDQAKANTEKNLKNARELFQSKLQETFANGKLKIDSGEWEEKKLNEIGIAQTGTTPKTSDKNNYGDFIPFVKPADIDFEGDGKIKYDNAGLSKQGLKTGRKMSRGSILMVCIGASIGKVGFSDRDVSCNQQINSITTKEKFNSKFVYYALSIADFLKQVILNSAQATLPIINKSKWENLTVYYPKSLAEQKDIVKKLDSVSTETKKLEAIYQRKITCLDELKKSILQKAFNGEL